MQATAIHSRFSGLKSAPKSASGAQSPGSVTPTNQNRFTPNFWQVEIYIPWEVSVADYRDFEILILDGDKHRVGVCAKIPGESRNQFFYYIF